LEHCDDLVCIDIIVALFDVHSHKVQLRGAMLFPLLNKALILLHDVVVVENCKPKSMLKHLGLEIFEHHVSIAELLIRGHVLGVRNLAVERHDWTERVTLGNQTQLARRKVMVVAFDIHHRLFNRLQRLFLKILDRHSHHHGPNRLTVVKNA